MIERCSVVTSLEPDGDWYPVCDKVAIRRMPVLDLPICEECWLIFQADKEEE